MLGILCSFVLGWFRARTDLLLENLALRHQLEMVRRSRTRLRSTASDRTFWVALSLAWSGWRRALVVVGPTTVCRWHRRMFARSWDRRARRAAGRPRVDARIRLLVRRMSSENPSWGAPRIHAELQKLGNDVSERTVSRLLRRRPRDPARAQAWLAFLRNHRDAIAAMDFFTVPTLTFDVLYVWFAIHHGRRRILHFAVTSSPIAPWIAQQLREAFPWCEAPSYLVHDRDRNFSREVLGTVARLGIASTPTSARSPWQNGVAERWIRSCRRELLDHVIVLNEAHLRRLLRDYVHYYNEDRCHLTLDKDAPEPRPRAPPPTPEAELVALPRCGGLHHRYAWRDAA